MATDMTEIEEISRLLGKVECTLAENQEDAAGWNYYIDFYELENNDGWFRFTFGGCILKVILFDFDGVLTVDAFGSVTIINYIVKETGINYTSVDKAYRKHNKELLLGIKKHEDMWDEFCNDLNTTIDYRILYDSFINTKLDLKMLEYVRSLKEAGYKLGIVTDNKKDRIEAIVNHNNLYELFEHIFISAEVGISKKNKEIFYKAIEAFSAEPNEYVFIDNTKDNLIAPLEIGMHTIYYDDKERDIERLKREINNWKSA